MDIVQATQAYEAWLASQITPVEADLQRKHATMASAVFPFLRATFYRWAQRWTALCPNLCAASAVLAVGDLHVENFGTWRDGDARLVWGINDLDEAWILPYTQDLVRLAASAHLACPDAQPGAHVHAACDAILDGYTRGMATAGEPFVLSARHGRLATFAAEQAHHKASTFWAALDDLPDVTDPIPAQARRLLESALPEQGLAYRVVHRVAGLGSLGRQRYTALAAWRGGPVAREVKALLPSAWSWAQSSATLVTNPYQRLLDGAVRSPDPTLRAEGGWVVRRLAPDNGRIELSALPAWPDESQLLTAMGLETANLHHATPAAVPAINADLQARGPHWLRHAVDAMVEASQEDWNAWRQHFT